MKLQRNNQWKSNTIKEYLRRFKKYGNNKGLEACLEVIGWL